MIKHLVDPGTPLAILTTSPEELNQSARQLGVAAIIGKPFDIDNLLRALVIAWLGGA